MKSNPDQMSLVFDGPGRLKGRKVIASVSGGRDSGAMSLHLKELGIEHDRVFMDTGWESPLTYEYLRGPLTTALGPIIEIRGQWDFLSVVKHKGLFPSRVMRFCTTELKVFPIQKYIAAEIEKSGGAEVVNAVGIRRAESKARSKMAEWEWSDNFDCETWRPLVNWTKDDVAAIHARHGLEMNPLYGMGAGRVGCFPCIHSSKKEIALVAKIDPERIDLIRTTERDLTAAGEQRDLGRDVKPVPRTMFSYHGGDSKHVPMPITEAIEWANSKRGEWQPPGAGDGCMRFGLCETSTDDEDDEDDVVLGGMTELELAVLAKIGPKVIAHLESQPPPDCACAECGHEQRTMDPCAVCGSVKTVKISVLEDAFGPDWRESFKD